MEEKNMLMAQGTAPPGCNGHRGAEGFMGWSYQQQKG